MPDRQRDMELFHWNPPRMFPHVEHQRPKIEGMLAQLAAVDREAYEERLEKYNALCDQYGVPRFAKVTVVREEIEEPKVKKVAPAEVPAEEPQEAAPASADSLPEEPPKKRGRKKKSEIVETPSQPEA